MSAMCCDGKPKLAMGMFVAIIATASFVRAGTPSTEKPQFGQTERLESSAPSATAWTVARPISSETRKPLARLIRNPDESGGLPPYALADQSGTIQRYVEPVPGIDLEPYVGYAVIVKHDTGRTLLASQLELPGQESEHASDRMSAGNSGSSGSVESLFSGILNGPSEPSPMPTTQFSAVQPAQPMAMQPFQSAIQPVQYVPNASTPIIIQDEPPPGDPQGVVTYDPMDPSMSGMPPGMPMNAYPPGAGPVYLDGPGSCGPPGCQSCPTCPQPQMYVQQPAPCPQPVLVQPPPPTEQWSMWGEALWLHPTGADMAYAQQQNGLDAPGTGAAGTVPFGEIGVVDPDFNLGFRVGGEVKYAPKESVFVSYAFYESNASSHLDVGPGGAVGSLVHHPGAAITASVGPMDATYDLDFQIGDAAYRYFVACSRSGDLSVFAGARFGQLVQDFSQTGIFGGGQGGTIDTTTSIDFDGVGPMAGVTGEHLIGQTRFSVYGKALVAAMTGEFRTHYSMFNSTTATLLAESIWNDDRIVPMLDYELGIAWTGPAGHFRLAAGYLASTWFNAVTTPVFVDAVQADNYVDVADSISFDGLVGRAECRW